LDWLAAAGMRWWQMLPVGPPGERWNSPYQTLSAFAGSWLLVSLDARVEEGLLKPDEVRSAVLPQGRARYAAARRLRRGLLERAFRRFGSETALEDFAHRNPRIVDYARFAARRELERGRPWWEWDERGREPDATLVRFHLFVQYCFERDFARIRQEAQRRGIGLIGDVPIFVAHDSADVWREREWFTLREDGRLEVQAGVPPDYFSRKGQRWGVPLYRWEVLRERGYGWWIDRLCVALARFDAVRLDHFIGFHRAWAIAGDARDGRRGQWQPGPGAEFFEHVRACIPHAQFIAEDLGVVVADVRALRDRFGFPGMRVLQFAFGPGSEEHRPDRAPRRCVVYTGTHDNDTFVGWWRDRGGSASTRSPEQVRQERRAAEQYLGAGDEDVHWRAIRAVFASPADTAIVPMQDVLGLGSEARMNRPGTVRGNWEWRLTDAMLTQEAAERLRAVAMETARTGSGGRVRAQEGS
jgi:4-alpha-glucanotransferase